jgi:hypothetical protein
MCGMSGCGFGGASVPGIILLLGLYGVLGAAEAVGSGTHFSFVNLFAPSLVMGLLQLIQPRTFLPEKKPPFCNH